MKQICPHCNCWMLHHPKLEYWVKCIGCGFCKHLDDEFKKAVREVMTTHRATLKKLKDSGD